MSVHLHPPPRKLRRACFDGCQPSPELAGKSLQVEVTFWRQASPPHTTAPILLVLSAPQGASLSLSPSVPHPGPRTQGNTGLRHHPERASCPSTTALASTHLSSRFSDLRARRCRTQWSGDRKGPVRGTLPLRGGSFQKRTVIPAHLLLEPGNVRPCAIAASGPRCLTEKNPVCMCACAKRHTCLPF